MATSLTASPSSPTLSFSPSPPLAAATSHLPIPTSPHLNPSTYKLPPRDSFSLSLHPLGYSRSSSFVAKRPRPSSAPLTRRVSLFETPSPSTSYRTPVKMCRPSSPIDRFYSAKTYTSDPMGLPDGLESLKDITDDDMSTGRRFVFLLDYDGTLTPIVDDPERALIAEETRSVIRDLAGRFHTAIVTGRSLEKVQKLVKLDECYYAGSHGWDIKGPVGSHVRKRVGSHYLAKFRTVLDRLDQIIDDRFEGATVEDNVFSVSIHYRNCSPDVIDELEDEVDRIAEDAGMLRKDGKMVFEIRPAFDWHKGKAVEYLVNTLAAKDPNIVPIYIGDDVTDEDAFKALNGRGISVIVADESTKRETYADLRLNDTEEVQTFLSFFAHEI